MTVAARPDYGIDAPGLLRAFVLIGAVALAIGMVLLARSSAWLAAPMLLVAGYALGMAGLMIRGSRVGKVRGREAILDLIDWTGDEHVLDIGCGRGLMLIGAARRLTTGRAIGVDLWLERDQGGNTPDAARRNAVIEGVAARIAIETADMRELPFADRAFDIIVSHWAVHNLATAADRAAALAEMARTVKPGGVVALTDIACRDEYRRELARLGMRDLRLVIASPALDRFYGLLSFGSYRPATIICRAPA